MSTLFDDPFDTNGASLGANYTDQGAAPWSVSGSVAVISLADYCESKRSAETFNNNQWCELTIGSTITSTSGHGIGPMVRLGTGTNSNCYFLQANTGATDLYERVSGGTYNLLASGAGVVAGDVLYLEANGTTITAKKNGTNLFSPVTSSSVSTGKPGIWGYDGPSGVACTATRLQGGDVDAGGGGGTVKRRLLLGVGI